MCSQSPSRRAGSLSRNNVLLTIGLLLLGIFMILFAIWAGSHVPIPKQKEQPSVQVVEVAPDMPKGNIHVPEHYREMLRYYCDEAGVPYALMARIATVESDWNPMAQHNGDLGLFQLNSKFMDYFAWKFNDGVEINPFDPEDSMRVACRYMRYLYLLCHDYRVATMAYNCGYKRLITDGPPKSTLRYVSMVFGFEFD
jgi:soluble lytic murein transglycosylase-like protein